MNKARVLVIEDEFMMQNLYADILENFDVASALTGRDAMRLIDSGQHYDLYIVDVGLPDCNGFDLIKIIRTQHSNSRVIVGTGYPIESLTDRIESTKPDFVISKPFKVSDFVKKVDALVQLPS